MREELVTVCVEMRGDACEVIVRAIMSLRKFWNVQNFSKVSDLSRLGLHYEV